MIPLRLIYTHLSIMIIIVRNLCRGGVVVLQERKPVVSMARLAIYINTLIF